MTCEMGAQAFIGRATPDSTPQPRDLSNERSEMIRRSTWALHARQRAGNLDFNVRHAATIASVRGRLLAHAARCRREKGYMGVPGQNRASCAAGLSGLAAKLGDRIRLRLGIHFHLDRAIEILNLLDRRNS